MFVLKLVLQLLFLVIFIPNQLDARRGVREHRRGPPSNNDVANIEEGKCGGHGAPHFDHDDDDNDDDDDGNDDDVDDDADDDDDDDEREGLSDPKANMGEALFKRRGIVGPGRNQNRRIVRKLSCKSKYNTSSGMISSPTSDTGTYPSQTKCRYTIKTDSNITISCSSFELQPMKNGKCKDYLLIKEPKTNNQAVKYCGTTGPENYVSTSTKVVLTFKSNRKKNYKGFNCSYEPVNQLLTSALEAHNTGATCNNRASSTCGCVGITSADSIYATQIVGNDRIVAANGIPNHVFETGQINANPNNACPHSTYMAIPLTPQKGSTYTEYGLGIVGMAISGGYLYNHLADPTGSTAVFNEKDSFDTCNGHSDPTCSYHYHKIPICLDENNCKLIGYMRDGFPVYSFCDSPEFPSRKLKSCYYLIDGGGDGSNKSHYDFSAANLTAKTCDLDQANGYTFADSRGYSYIFTADYPYIMAGYYGTVLSDVCHM